MTIKGEVSWCVFAILFVSAGIGVIGYLVGEPVDTSERLEKEISSAGQRDTRSEDSPGSEEGEIPFEVGPIEYTRWEWTYDDSELYIDRVSEKRWRVYTGKGVMLEVDSGALALEDRMNDLEARFEQIEEELGKQGVLNGLQGEINEEVARRLTRQMMRELGLDKVKVKPEIRDSGILDVRIPVDSDEVFERREE